MSGNPPVSVTTQSNWTASSQNRNAPNNNNKINNDEGGTHPPWPSTSRDRRRCVSSGWWRTDEAESLKRRSTAGYMPHHRREASAKLHAPALALASSSVETEPLRRPVTEPLQHGSTSELRRKRRLRLRPVVVGVGVALRGTQPRARGVDDDGSCF